MPALLHCSRPCANFAPDFHRGLTYGVMVAQQILVLLV